MTDHKLHVADTATGVIVLVSGVCVALGAWNMPRFEERSINPWTVPGIMPGFVGAVLSILGLLLLARGTAHLIRSRRLKAPRNTIAAKNEGEVNLAITGLPALIVCLTLGILFVALVGHVPFIPLTFVFLLSFTVAFETPTLLRTEQRLVRSLWIVAYAGAASVLIPILFRDVFLVQLP